jgi:PAS domain-containing protein
LPLARTMLKGEWVRDEEIHFVRGDGSPGVMLASSSPVVDHQGRLTAGVLTFHDITERKVMEDELRAARDELELRVRERTSALSAANRELHDREEEARRQAEHAQALAAVAARLSASLDLDGVLRTVCEETARVLHVPAVSGAIYRPDADELDSVFHLNLPEEFVARLRPGPRDYYEHVLQRFGPILVVEDLDTLHGSPNVDLLIEYNVRGLIGCTILHEGRPVGGLTL